MGFDLDRFTRSVDDDFKCSICLGVFENPLATPCGHVFCANCVLPWVVQHGSCPLKCENFSTKELNSVLPLRNLILKLDIRCDNHSRGCQLEIKIPMLSQHLEDCDYVPVQCSNKGCQEEVNIKDQVVHETQCCEFRPVGRCDKGCGLVLQHNGITDHVCLKALQSHANSLQSKIANQEHNLKKTTMRFGKREKSLLAQIACLQNEIQMQALRYQKKLNECKAEIEYLAALKAHETQPNDNDEEKLSLIISKDNNNGSLGLNIIGGSRTEGGLSEGIIVSRILDGGAADNANLKIHDRIMKVNGIDLTQATHEEAVEAFKNAAEPIAVEVVRRAPRTTTVVGDKDRTVCTCNIGTQTDIQSEDLLWKMLQQCPSPLSPMSPMTPTGKSDVDFDGLCELSPGEPLTVMDRELILNDMEGMDNLDMPIIDEDGLDKAYEMEYEEMTICRNNRSDKLGLTLCYGQEDDTGIFISEVDPNSISGEDGRIKEGDQILQINGEDVHNKDQALELFAQQPETTLLVCRPQLRLEDCLYDERNALLDDLQLDMLEQTHQEAMQFTSSLLHDDDDDDECDDRPDEEDGQTDTTGTTTTGSTNHHEKDSGVGRATDGASNTTDDDGSNQKFPMDSGSLGSGEMRYSNDSFTSNETPAESEYNGQISLEDCLKFQAALESKCDKHMRSDTDESLRGKDSKVMRLGSDSMETTSQSGDSLNRNCRKRLGSDPEVDQCEQLNNGQSSSQISSPITNGNMAEVFGESKDVDTERDTRKMDSNSAKNSPKHRPGELVIGDTDDSADSSPVCTPLIVQKPPKRAPSDSTVSSSRLHRAPRTVPGSPSRSKSSSSRSKSDRSSSSDSRKAKGSPAKTLASQSQQQQQPPPLPPPRQNVPLLPYPRRHPRPATNPHLRGQQQQPPQQMNSNPYLMQQEQAAQLIRNNWKLQQQHQTLRNSMQKYGSMQSIMSVPAHAKHYRSYMHLVDQNVENQLLAADSGTDRSSKSATEWKVKVRSDGTRYITKKSTARDRVLKERANRIHEERGGGMTTDDEAMTEMKLGKYWSKEDRKRHLERIRDQKRRREFMMQARMECLQEQEEIDGKKPMNIVELSHRKFLKKRGREMLMDNFTTVQEMLVHGTRISPETAKEFNPWLNVTTV